MPYNKVAKAVALKILGVFLLRIYLLLVAYDSAQTPKTVACLPHSGIDLSIQSTVRHDSALQVLKLIHSADRLFYKL